MTNTAFSLENSSRSDIQSAAISKMSKTTCLFGQAMSASEAVLPFSSLLLRVSIYDEGEYATTIVEPMKIRVA